MRMKFTPREIIALSVLLPALFCGLAAAEESTPSTPPASIPAARGNLPPVTFLVKNETGDSGESAVASEPRAADAQAVIDACKAGESARALKAAKKLIAATPDRADLADLLIEAGGMLGTAKKIDPAAGFYRLLIDHYPQSKHLELAHTEFAACCYLSGKLKEAHPQVKENLKLYPKSQWVEYWEILDSQISYRLHDFARAQTGYEAFLAKYPNSKYATYARADLGRIAPQMETDRNGIARYSGTFEKDIRFQAALAATPKYVEDGYGILERRLGIDLRNHANVLIQFRDAGFKSSGGVKAHTRIVGAGDKQNTMIEFFTEYVVENPEVYRRTVVHEMKHAGFAEMMGGRAYGTLPGWIKEGLAIWGSEDADTRVILVLANTVFSGGDPMRVLDGIEEEGKDNNDFLEGCLAFDFLESRKAGNVKTFCQRLVKGEPYREIWADVVGTSYEEAVALAVEYSRQRVNNVLGEAYATFVPLQKGAEAAVAKGGEAAKAWLADGGESDLKNWLETHRQHPAAPCGRFWLGRALIDAGRHDDGRAMLQQIIDEDVDRCTLLDDAQFFIGYSYNLQSDAKSLEAFGILLRDYPYSVHAKQFIGKMPPAGPVTR